MSRFAIKTTDGYVTSRRVAWRASDVSDGRDVWTWRTEQVDPGEPPLTFDSAEEATAWMNQVTIRLVTRKERAEMDAYWHVEEMA